jgi:hypothetical protein
LAKTIRIENGDIFVDERGFTSWTTGLRKANQDTFEALTTPYDPLNGFGCELNIGSLSPVLPRMAATAFIESALSDAIDRLITKQGHVITLAEDETILGIDSLEITDHSNGLGTDIAFDVHVLTEAGIADESVRISLAHTNPAILFRRTIHYDGPQG